MSGQRQPDPQLAASARALVVGVQRAPLPPLPDLEPHLSAVEPPERLLDALALGVARESLGRRPLQLALEGLASEPPQDERAVPPPKAVAILSRLLEQGRGSVELEHWLELCRARGLRPPHAALPALLELGEQDPELGSLLRPLLGPRGAWLAAREPRWSRFARGAEGPLPDDWVTRVAVLRGRSSEEASAALDAGWAEASARARMLALSRAAPVDAVLEPRFEVALDDRAKTVRARAAHLLASFPESQLVGRMQSRLRDRLRLQGGVLTLVPPSTLSGDAERDGIERAPPGAASRRRSWVEQMLARTPPWWSEALLGESPEQLVEAALHGAAKESLLLGWSASVLRYRELGGERLERWTRALLSVEGPADGSLLASLGATELERVLRTRLSHRRPEWAHRVLTLVAGSRRLRLTPWLAGCLVDLTRALDRQLGAHFPRSGLFSRIAADVELVDEASAQTMLHRLQSGNDGVSGATWSAIVRATEALEWRLELVRAFDG